MKYILLIMHITYVLDCLVIFLLIIKEIINKYLTRLIFVLQIYLLEVSLLYIKNKNFTICKFKYIFL